MIIDLLTGEEYPETEEDIKSFDTAHNEYENYKSSILNGNDSYYLDQAVEKYCEQNIYPGPTIEVGTWHSRARSHHDCPSNPFIDKDIGVSPNPKYGRWNEKGEGLLYLCKGTKPEIPIREIDAVRERFVTLGHFRVEKSLNLVCLRRDLGSFSDTHIDYCGLSANEFMWVMEDFKNDYFIKHAEKEKEKELIYCVTNYFGKIFKKCGIDGFLYTSAVDKKTQNIALINYEKVSWRYSELYELTDNKYEKRMTIYRSGIYK